MALAGLALAPFVQLPLKLALQYFFQGSRGGGDARRVGVLTCFQRPHSLHDRFDNRNHYDDENE
jgi:hypothetical protein